MSTAGDQIAEWFASFYDRVYSERRQRWLEHNIARLAALSFVIHLFLIFLARTLRQPGSLLSAVGTNYLSAIFTPFSFILFNEVLMLIAAVPKSTTQSIAKQFEIVSLIFIRRFFKDIAHLDRINEVARLSPEVLPIFRNVTAGIVMFGLVSVFLGLARRHRDLVHPSHSEELRRFIARKKVIALGLVVTLVLLAIYNLIDYALDEYRQIYLHSGANHDSNTFFYVDLFAVMIFTDVLIVIFSLVVSDSYELVFRNEAFVISTILLRFSLTVDQLDSAILALSGMAFGIVTLLIYNYLSNLKLAERAVLVVSEPAPRDSETGAPKIMGP